MKHHKGRNGALPVARYDAVIIGGGTAGLSCGLALVRRGKRVVICEQHSVPGGYVTSFARKGFRFDGGAGCFSSGGIVFPVLRALEVDKAVRTARIDFAVVAGGERAILTSPEATIDGLSRLCPGSRDDLSRSTTTGTRWGACRPSPVHWPKPSSGRAGNCG